MADYGITSKDPKPGFRWPISSSVVIAAPPEKVWQVISSPGNLERCHPFCDRNPVDVWSGAESRDRIYYLSGWFYERIFLDWFECSGYDLEVGRPDGGKSYVTWRIKPVSRSRSELQITVYPHALQQVHFIFRWLPHIVYLKPMLKKYLDSVTRGFKWYIETREPVSRNQFGAHRWFSAR